jgi:hypothetical protein
MNVISVKGHGANVQQEELNKLENQVVLLGIEPATFRLVAA